MGNVKIRANKAYDMRLFAIFPLALITKIIQYTLMPAKAFFDSENILGIMQTSPNFIFAPSSYNNTAVFSNAINIFGFRSLLQWSVFFALIFNIILFVIANNYEMQGWRDWAWLYATFGLLNLYTFNLSKEIFQFCIFLIIYRILKMQIGKRGLLCKVLLSVSVLFFWGLIYRIYYCLIAAYVIMVYFIASFSFKPKKLRYFFTLVVLGILISFFSIQVISPENYSELVFTRDNNANRHYGDENSQTALIDIFENTGNPVIFLANTIITAIRLMIPIELIAIGLKPQYFMFLIYQLLVTTYYVKVALSIFQNRANETQQAAFFVFSGFLIGSALFELGFTSWPRHESAIIPIMLLWRSKERSNAKMMKVKCLGG